MQESASTAAVGRAGGLCWGRIRLSRQCSCCSCDIDDVCAELQLEVGVDQGSVFHSRNTKADASSLCYNLNFFEGVLVACLDGVLLLVHSMFSCSGRSRLLALCSAVYFASGRLLFGGLCTTAPTSGDRTYCWTEIVSLARMTMQKCHCGASPCCTTGTGALQVQADQPASPAGPFAW